MQSFYDKCLLQLIAAQHHPAPIQRFLGKHRLLIYLVIAATFPIMATPTGDSATNNIITRYAWHLAHIGFYGLGAVVAFLGIVVPIAKKAAGVRTEVNPIASIAWSLALFAAPHLLKYGIEFFQSDAAAGGALDDMVHDFDIQ